MTCQCSCCQEHAADIARLNRALAEAQEENRVAVASFNSEWARATRALVAATIAGKERDMALNDLKCEQIRSEDRGTSYARLRSALDYVRSKVDGYDSTFELADEIAAGTGKP